MDGAWWVVGVYFALLLGAQWTPFIEEELAVCATSGQMIKYQITGLKVGPPLVKQFPDFLCPSDTIYAELLYMKRHGGGQERAYSPAATGPHGDVA